MQRTVKTAKVKILTYENGVATESTITSFNTEEKKIVKELRNCGIKAIILSIEIVPVLYHLDDSIFFEYATIVETPESTETH